MFPLLTLTVRSGRAPRDGERRGPFALAVGNGKSFRSATSRSICCNEQRIRAVKAPVPVFLLLTLTVHTGSPPTGRWKAEPARASRWKRELLSSGDFSLELLQRATEACSQSSANCAYVANFNSSHGKPPNRTVESGARESEPLETGTPSFGDFSLELLQRATEACSQSSAPCASVTNFNSSHGKSPNRAAESGARESEPLETGTLFVRRLLARVVATSNGIVQPEQRSRSFRAITIAAIRVC